MTHIKSMKIHGFKSFAKPTELIFDKDLSIVVGRLSAKSLRAKKSANLIYNGGKNQKSADEAKVEMILDNFSKTFPIEENEISIERIVRRDGNSIYRINGKNKTRQEMQELLGY